MADYKDTIYTHRVRVTKQHDRLLMTLKGKKSKAGKLREIIDFYVERKRIEKQQKQDETQSDSSGEMGLSATSADGL